MDEMNERAKALNEIYLEKAKALNNEELIKGWEEYVNSVCYNSHSAKENIAIEVYGQELISRKLKTLIELQEFYKVNEIEGKKRRYE
jgi:hypothetical protein